MKRREVRSSLASLLLAGCASSVLHLGEKGDVGSMDGGIAESSAPGGQGGEGLPPAGGGGSGGTDGTGASSPADDGGVIDVEGGPTRRFVLRTGSYDIVLRHVQVTPYPGAPAPPLTLSHSEGATLRLDYREENGAHPAASVTPRWGDAAEYSVSWDGDIMVLTGGARVQGSTDSAVVDDAWTALRLSSRDGGTASLEAIGSERVTQDGIGRSAQVTAEGDVQPDLLAPELKSIILSDIGPADALLPWDSIGLRAAEGVQNLTSAIEATMTYGGGVTTAFSIDWQGGENQVDWVGTLSVSGFAHAWDSLSGSSVDLSVPGSAITDLVGHPLSETFFANFRYVDVGEPVDEYTFVSGPFPGAWGDVHAWSQSDLDPLCGSGGCVVLGPFENGDCVPRIGIAGRLKLQESVLAVRYRVFSTDGPDGGSPNLADGLPPFTVQAVTFGYGPVDTPVKFPELHDLGATAGELHWSSDDLTIEADAAAETGDFGFAIYTGDPSRIHCGKASPKATTGTRTAVVIEQIGRVPPPD